MYCNWDVEFHMGYKTINVSEYRVLVCSDTQGLFLVAELLKVSVESSKCCSIGDL